MYNSPINMIYGQLQTHIEGEIMRAVQNVDVHVDKDELLRALQYDRGQYDKGYQDGSAAAVPKWIPVTERLPEGGDRFTGSNMVIVLDDTGKIGIGAYFVGEGWYCHNCNFYVNHWMPLPEPPREGTT